jgi:ATP-dependent protease ClpP protease subunit
MVEYIGAVSSAANERVLKAIKELLTTAPKREIVLLVTSAGGPSGVGMSFYDTLRSVLKPRLVTIGSGDVDSSGVILFLAGETRFVTKHTTMFLHLAGRVFEDSKRLTAQDLEMMAREDRLKDAQYAEIVADNSHGKLTQTEVLEMMQTETLLTPGELISLGLADTILG